MHAMKCWFFSDGKWFKFFFCFVFWRLNEMFGWLFSLMSKQLFNSQSQHQMPYHNGNEREIISEINRLTKAYHHIIVMIIFHLHWFRFFCTSFCSIPCGKCKKCWDGIKVKIVGQLQKEWLKMNIFWSKLFNSAELFKLMYFIFASISPLGKCASKSL